MGKFYRDGVGVLFLLPTFSPLLNPSCETTCTFFDLSPRNYLTLRLTLNVFSQADWVFHTIGSGHVARSFGDLLPDMQRAMTDIMPKIEIKARPDVIVLAKGE